jgi:two-component system, OmpR family, phosphate regulon sensor histidine kinase PhoR
LKSVKPLNLLIIGSSVVSILILVVIFLADFLRDEITPGVVFLIWLCSFVFTFGIFYVLIRRFIDERLKILYRSIRKGKFSSEEKIQFKMSQDVITAAERDAKLWTEERLDEISKLKGQEEFRREFLGNLAHELKTPIFSIQGYLLTLLDGGLEDEKVNRQFLERASKATDRMVSIVEDLDQITKIEVDDLKMDFKTFDIVELIEDIVETLQIRAEEKNIQLKFSKNYEPTLVYADKTKISQVLTNLIHNSISYGDVNGETLFRIYELDNIVTVEVADNGPGIEQSVLPRIFERFYRVEKSRNRNEGGSGLGLAIVKHIIESHGQTINVRSTVGVGSTFAFTLNKSKQSSLLSMKR